MCGLLTRVEASMALEFFDMPFKLKCFRLELLGQAPEELAVGCNESPRIRFAILAIEAYRLLFSERIKVGLGEMQLQVRRCSHVTVLSRARGMSERRRQWFEKLKSRYKELARALQISQDRLSRILALVLGLFGLGFWFGRCCC